MKMVRKLGVLFALAGAAGAAVLYAASPVRGFDYRLSQTTVNKPATDISDVYFFPSPASTNNVVAVMDMNPGLTAGTGPTTFFDPTVIYTMHFDTNFQSEALSNRPVDNLVIQFSFGPVANGTQQVYVYGIGAPNETGTTTTLVNGGFATGTGLINQSFPVGNMTVFAGVREDPFFFDLAQYFNIIPDRNGGSTSPSCLPGVGNGTCPQGFNNPGTDFFNNRNVLSIVVELPKTTLQPSGSTSVIGYWATSSVQL